MRIRVTSDKTLATEIRKKIRENNGYCPCSLVKDEDHKCMCKDFIEQGLGPCHCGLYVKVEV